MRNVPKLRFKEFSGEWEEKSILEIVKDEKNSIKIGPFGSQLKKERFVEKSNFKVYGQENVLTKDFSVGNRYMTESHFRELCTNEIKSGDFLISSMGTIGQSIIVPKGIEQGIMDSHLIRLRLKNEIANSKFIQQVFLLDKTQNKILSLSVGGIMAGLSIGIIKKLFFTLPTLYEQQKIADFLSNVDKKISITEEKLSLFNDYKKGIMQKIFNQELRFKDENGNDYPEWEEKKLSELSNKIGDGIHSTPNYSDNGEYFFINGNNIKDNKVFINETTKKIDEEEYNKYRLSLNNNTILISINGTIGNLGYYNYEKVILGKSCGYINLKDENNKCFLLNLLKTQKIQSYFFQELTGTTIKNLSLQTLKNTIVKLPIFNEQQKIADFLSAIDSKIEKISDELENLKEFKKGLLQQMFV